MKVARSDPCCHHPAAIAPTSSHEVGRSRGRQWAVLMATSGHFRDRLRALFHGRRHGSTHTKRKSVQRWSVNFGNTRRCGLHSVADGVATIGLGYTSVDRAQEEPDLTGGVCGEVGGPAGRAAWSCRGVVCQTRSSRSPRRAATWCDRSGVAQRRWSRRPWGPLPARRRGTPWDGVWGWSTSFQRRPPAPQIKVPPMHAAAPRAKCDLIGGDPHSARMLFAQSPGLGVVRSDER